jgi:hypothetical protein
VVSGVTPPGTPRSWGAGVEVLRRLPLAPRPLLRALLARKCAEAAVLAAVLAAVGWVFPAARSILVSGAPLAAIAFAAFFTLGHLEPVVRGGWRLLGGTIVGGALSQSLVLMGPLFPLPLWPLAAALLVAAAIQCWRVDRAIGSAFS